MKKILLSLSMCFLVVAVMAQAPAKVSKVPSTKKVQSAFVSALNGNEAAPQNNASESLRTPLWGGIGSTYYDAVTNGCSRNTITTFDDGTTAAVWTMASTNASRGTGYNYFNGTSWNDEPDPTTGRIESVRTGWGVIAPLGNGEIVVSHNGANTGGALVVNIRDTKGTGTWTESLLYGPEVPNAYTPSAAYPAISTCLLWPTIATVGDTIHIFACTDSDTFYKYHGTSACLVYYRSCDRGATWDIQHQVINCLTDRDLSEVSGDDYTLTAKNGKLVLGLASKFYDTYYCESNDGGNTWTKHIVYPFPGGADFDFDTDFFGPCLLCDNTLDVAIGDDGTVHVVFGTQRCERDADNAAGEYSLYYFNEYDGAIYWNSTMSPLPVLDSVYMSTYDRLIARPNLDGDDTIWYSGLEGITLPEYRTNGAVTFPTIVAENGKVYVTYAAAMEAPYICTSLNTYYYGIFGTVSNDNGTTWNIDGNTSWLSYNKDNFFVDWESTELYGELFLEQESENFWPAMAANSANGKLSVMWYYDYVPGQVAGLSSDAPTNVYSIVIDKDEFGTFCNTQEVYNGSWNWVGINENALSEMKLYPNPANDMVTLAISSKDNSQANITVTNLMGQVVYSQSASLNIGVNNFQMNVSDLNAGIYIVNVKSVSGVSAQKLIVR